jgi:hypothetical protein
VRALAVVSWSLWFVGVVRAEAPQHYRCLADAYADVVRFRDGAVVLRDGSTIRWDDGHDHKTPDQRIDDPDLDDMFAVAYPAGGDVRPPAPDEDPGRARVTALFDALYGRTEADVKSALVNVEWLGHTLPFNRRQGAAAALASARADLEKLPPAFRKFFARTSGTFNRRTIAGTTRPSAHGWGIAIDLDAEHSDYWRWNRRADGALPYRNRIPIEIVRVFERHGFIWGGRWHHYDTMHFEYRPELLRCAEVRR